MRYIFAHAQMRYNLPYGRLRYDINPSREARHARRAYRIEDISRASAYIANPARDLYRRTVSLETLCITAFSFAKSHLTIQTLNAIIFLVFSIG